MILPEYRAVRKKLSGFKELVKNPEFAAEVTIQPVDILNVDAAIIFSDILVVPEAMGLNYQMIEKKGPYFEKTIRSINDLSCIEKEFDIEDRLGYVSQAIKITNKELNRRVPLIGFAGAPWTIFCYKTEGDGSKTFSKVAIWSSFRKLWPSWGGPRRRPENKKIRFVQRKFTGNVE